MATSTSEFQGFKVIVTGASSGIGLATARYYHERGASVALLARRKSVLDSIVAELGERALAVGVDVTNEEALKAAIAESIEFLGGLDVLVNNAGGLGDIKAATASPLAVTVFDDLYQLNVRPVIIASNAAIDALLASKGSIINVSSVLSFFPDKGLAAYATSKATLDMVTKTYAFTYAPLGVRVNSVNPAIINTPIFETNLGLKPEQVDSFGPSLPIGRVGRPEEVAATIAFLSSKGAGFITGELLLIDGGANLTRWGNQGNLFK